VPQGEFINDKQSFLQEAQNYVSYFNSQKSHNGKGMQERTPLKTFEHCQVLGAQKLLDFPVLIIENHIELIRKHTD